MNKFAIFVRGLLIGVILGAAGCFVIFSYLNTPEPGTAIDSDGNIIIDENIVSKTLADFQDAIMQKEIDKNELVVMEQPISVTMTISEMGLGNWEIFSKTKQITFFGTGVYTVDMGSLKRSDIKMDADSKTITISFRGSELTYVNLDIEKTEFEETDKGLLSFGDITLTTEQQQQLELQVRQSMTRTLESDSYKQLADGFAQVNIWKIYQPVVTSVSNGYNTIVNIE